VSFPPAVSLELAWGGFQRPVYLAHAGDESRLYLVEQAGKVYLLEDGRPEPTVFLDITDRVLSQGSEQGLLSIAFPAETLGSGEFYVNYTDSQGNTVVARYRLSDGDPRQADPSSEEFVIQIVQPAVNHNGGQLQFGPDGYLYVGMGDGGRGGDPWGNAQDPNTMLGKMLRLDVIGSENYRVPATNPFVGQDGFRSEIWALGLRNPWRFAFDRVTGDLFIGDVGQNRYEEIHLQPADSGGGENYGWDIVEGSYCFEPESGCDASGLEMPIAEYDHGQGCSVTGGAVYRGSRYPQMVGVYFYGDFCSGSIWGLWRNVTGEWTSALLLQTSLSISSFGEDAAGELYVLDYSGGSVHHLIAVE
jgi:glucose/arabinose dehydrogenase